MKKLVEKLCVMLGCVAAVAALSIILHSGIKNPFCIFDGYGKFVKRNVVIAYTFRGPTQHAPRKYEKNLYVLRNERKVLVCATIPEHYEFIIRKDSILDIRETNHR